MSSLAPAPRLALLLASALQRRRLWQVLLAALVLLVCYLAFSPTPPPQTGLMWDKVNHLLAFGTLTVVGNLGHATTRGRLLAVIAALFAFGAFIEVVQAFVPGRSSEWEDLVADSVGIALGAAAALLLQRLARAGASVSSTGLR